MARDWLTYAALRFHLHCTQNLIATRGSGTVVVPKILVGSGFFVVVVVADWVCGSDITKGGEKGRKGCRRQTLDRYENPGKRTGRNGGKSR